MSQASRSRARALVRWREQAARILVDVGSAISPWPPFGDCYRQPTDLVLDGGCTFDVHAAREHARSMVAMGGDRRAPMGRSIARQGQRLLDMLDGRCAWAPSAPRQPSECQAGCVRVSASLGRLSPAQPGDHMQPRTRVQRAGCWVTCPDCRGTGHNLRGFVPDVEWPAVIRRKVIRSRLNCSISTRSPLPVVVGHIWNI